MSEYDPKAFKAGEMDIEHQQETFAGFMKVCVWTTIIVALICIFLLIVGV